MSSIHSKPITARLGAAKTLPMRRRTSLPRTAWGITSLLFACLASPCCAPLLVPIVLALFAGTPLALFLAQYIGWIYGGLTALSLVSFYLGWRWLSRRDAPQSATTCLSPSSCQTNCTCKEVQS